VDPSISPSAAQTILYTPCITVTSTATIPCTTSHICPEDVICPPVTETLTQACSCGLPAETFWQTVSCTCPGCEIITAVPSNTCVPVPCPVVTETVPPDCSPIIGCVTPDCILYSTITIPCGCGGIQTIAECDGNCPTGCETLYTGEHLPCPTTPLFY
jgi:hypothetical protein